MSLVKLCLCVALTATFAFAHPHVFVDATVKVLFDDKGFTGIRNRWVYDELYSMAMMSSGDADGDGAISAKENDWFCSAILDPLKEHNYYNYVQLGSSFLKAKALKDFKASFKDGRLVLEFTTAFSSALSPDYTMLVIVVSDPTNYIQMTTDMENADVDAPESVDVEFFNDGLDGLTLFRAFRSDIEGLFLRFKKK